MSEQRLFLGLLETAGNQAYIFATNRLRENVGASQRVWEAGVEFTYRAAKKVTRYAGFDTLRKAARKGPACYAKAMEQAPRLDDEGVEIEVVLATSGKALFLAREKSKAEDLIATATRMALEKAPGLILRGAVVENPGQRREGCERRGQGRPRGDRCHPRSPPRPGVPISDAADPRTMRKFGASSGENPLRRNRRLPDRRLPAEAVLPTSRSPNVKRVRPR